MTLQLELGGPASEVSWSGLSDGDFLRAVVWKRGTAPDITKPAKKGDVGGFASALAAFWKANPESGSPPRHLSCEAVWSLAAFYPSAREQALADVLALQVTTPKTKDKKQHTNGSRVNGLETWWEQANIAESPFSMWEYLALLEVFPSRIGQFSSTVAFAIWRNLLTIALDRNGLARLGEVKTGDESPDEEMTRYGYRADPFLDLSLLRNCELPWLAGVVLSPVKGADKLRKMGAELLEHELVERTDENGVPHADLLPRLPLWLAVSTRILNHAARRQITLWDEDAAELYRTFVEKAAPLIHSDGRFALSHVQMADPRAFAEELLRTSDWSEASAAIKSLLTPAKSNGKAEPSGKNGAATRRSTGELCIAPVSQSDEAAWAIMRTNWGARADRCTVTYDQPQQILELTVQGQRVLEGEWLSEVTSADKTTSLRGDWTCVCWQTDDDADYVELQLILDGVLLAERQVLLSRTRQFCFIAETLSKIEFDQFQYRTRLPLVKEVTAKTSSTTREVQLTAGGVPIRVFPVALPDQHVHSTPGKFGADLTFNTTASGAAWYNPVLIDWSPARRSATAIWKSLTVAEEQKIVRPDVAAGHRIKVGNHQWLIYRSLKETIEPRSVLGHQTRYETVIGSVESNGEITPLMLVEP